MSNANVFIPSVHVRGFAFGYTINAQGEHEGVYVSNGLVESAAIQEGSSYEMILAPNHPDLHNSAPWRAVRVKSKDDPVMSASPPEVSGGSPFETLAPKTPKEVSVGQILGAVTDGMGTGPWNPAEVADLLGVSENEKVAETLDHLHRTGFIACCKIYGPGEHEKPEECFYAKDVPSLMYGEEEYAQPTS